MITCIIPAYNESKRISRVISVVRLAKSRGIIDKIIVVSDGSTDRTVATAKTSGADQIISYSKNHGKGYAILEGLKSAKDGDILFLDADLIDLKVEHITKIIAAAKDPNVLMAIGFMEGDIRQKVAPHLSGQRFVKRKLADEILKQKWQRSRHTIEILMNRLAHKLKGKTVMVPLCNLTHAHKGEKYNGNQAFYHRFLFSFGLAKIYKTFLFGLFFAVILFYLGVIIFTPLKPRNYVFSAIPQIVSTDRILVIVAHPDDESLAAGGLMNDAVQKGAKVTVVVTSNGDSNKFSADVLNKTVFPSKADFVDEGKTRLAESTQALNQLGVTDIYFLGFPDRYLKELLNKNWSTPLKSKYSGLSSNQYVGTYKPDAPYQGSALLEELKDIITLKKPTTIVTHMTEDTNSDHQSVSRFTMMATDELQNHDLIAKPTIYVFLVHWKAGQYPRPFKQAVNFPLNPPEELRNKCSWKIYPLNLTTQTKKRVVLKDYRSQLKSPYLEAIFDAMDRTNELFCPLN